MDGRLETDRWRLTALSVGALGSYAYCLYALGPLLALLRADLDLSYTTVSMHSSLWAVGTLVTGLLYSRAAARAGRRRLFWASAAGTVAGALLFVVGYAVAVTLVAAAVLGTAGTFLLTATTTILSDEYADRADHALMGANIVASGTAVVAPLLLGLLAGTVLGWRCAMLVPVAAIAVLAGRYRTVSLPQPVRATGAAAPLTAAYWVAAGLVAVVVGVELCIVFHGAGLLRDHNGLTAADAATAMSLFYVAELLGRIGGQRLTRRPGRAVSLTGAALAVTAVGFTVFWLVSAPWLALAGLTAAGLGVANLYPLSVALAMRAAPDQTDAAAGRIQLLVGVAVLVAPLALGALADRVGVQDAYVVELFLLALAVALLAATRRTAQLAAVGS